jgi:hypothetical protein
MVGDDGGVVAYKHNKSPLFRILDNFDTDTDTIKSHQYYWAFTTNGEFSVVKFPGDANVVDSVLSGKNIEFVNKIDCTFNTHGPYYTTQLILINANGVKYFTKKYSTVDFTAPQVCMRPKSTKNRCFLPQMSKKIDRRRAKSDSTVYGRQKLVRKISRKNSLIYFKYANIITCNENLLISNVNFWRRMQIFADKYMLQKHIFSVFFAPRSQKSENIV